MDHAIPLFDGHCDTILRCYQRGSSLAENDGHLDLARVGKFAPYAQFFALFGDSAACGGKPLRRIFEEELALYRREIGANHDRIAHCTTAAQARFAFRRGKAAAFLSVEGAELLDCDLGRLEEAWRLGVRAVNLTWNRPNALSGTNAAEQDRGLSPLGRAFVRRMEELGMLVDVSHLSDPGFWDVAEMAQKPFFASHSNSRAVFFDPRNLTDAQFTAIIEHHGVAGLNLYAGFLGEEADLDTVVAHLEHFLALGGEANVSLGGDWDGCETLPRGVSGIQDMDRLYERLLRRNYPEALVRALFYDNLMRVVSEVCTM